MNCRRYRKQLMPWLDGEFSIQRSTELKAWFESCASIRQCSKCSSHIKAYHHIHHTLKSMPTTEFPSHMHSRIMDVVRSDQQMRRNQQRRFVRTVPVAAAVLLSLFMGSFVGIKTFDTTSTSALNASSSSPTESLSFGMTGLMAEFDVTGGRE